MLPQVAPGAAPLADGLVDDEQRVTRSECRRALPPLLFQLGAAGSELGEIELFDEKAPGPIEVVNVIMQCLDAPDADGGSGHDLNISAYLRPWERASTVIRCRVVTVRNWLSKRN